jgi:hypothetical protein
MSANASGSAESAPPRLPPFFPRSPRACAAQSEALFSCLDVHGEYRGGGAADAGVGRAALAGPCAALVPPYSACVSAALTSKQKELARAPQTYLAQLAAK